MSYKLFVGEEPGKKSTIWLNYCNTFTAHALSSSTKSKYDFAKNNLPKYHAWDNAGTPYIEFETEEDAMIFKLLFE